MNSSLTDTQITELSRKQEEMASEVKVSPLLPALQSDDLLLALDIQYQEDQAFVGAAIQSWSGEEEVRHFALSTHTVVPYHSGLFCFREGPSLKAFVDILKVQFPDLLPRLLLVDGHGLAHPRGLGVASWLGVQMSCPTLGCAKNTLLPYESALGEEKGSKLPIYRENQQVGSVLRRQTRINPVFVSAGHLITLPEAEQIVLKLPSDYRLPDLLRYADQNARALARGEQRADLKVLFVM